MCNSAPFATGNWTRFWEVSAPGSELQVVMNAGHLQFADVAGAWDGVCCTGCMGLLSSQVCITSGFVGTLLNLARCYPDLLNWRLFIVFIPSSLAHCMLAALSRQLCSQPGCCPVCWMPWSHPLCLNKPHTFGLSASLFALQEATEYALTPMVAWFMKELRGLNPGVSLADQPGFHQWVCSNEQAKKLQYVVRARGPICGSVPDGTFQLESGTMQPEDDVKRTPLFHLDSSIGRMG
jgi:hypothetical protein